MAVFVQGPDQLLVDVAHQHLLNGLHGLVVGDAQTVLELHGHVQALEHGIDGLAAAVHEHDAHAHELEHLDVGHHLAAELRVLHGRAAVLDDEGLAAHLVDPGQGLAEQLGLTGRAVALHAVTLLHVLLQTDSDGNVAVRKRDCPFFSRCQLRAVVAVDGDVVVREVAGPDARVGVS